MQKTYEPPPAPAEPEQEEEEEEVAEPEEEQEVNADARIAEMSRRKEEYTKVYQAQMTGLDELEKAIIPQPLDTSSPPDAQVDEHITRERTKIQQQRIAIREQYVRLMVQCMAVASHYGKFSPAPFIVEPKSGSKAPVAAPRVQAYSYQPVAAAPQVPQVKPAAVALTYAPQKPAPAYVPGPPPALDMSVYDVTQHYAPASPAAPKAMPLA